MLRHAALAAVVAAEPAGTHPAQALIESGHWKRARALLQPAPTDAAGLSLLSRVKWAFYDESSVIKHAEQAIAQQPSNADYHFHLAQILGEAAGRANKLRAIGLGRRCKQEIDTALSLDPRHTFALFARMLFLYEAPGIVGGDKAQSFATAAQIERLEPARANFGRARLAAHDPNTARDAEGYYRKAVELNPRYYSALVELANLYRTDGSGRYTLAEKFARDAQQAEPDRIGAYLVLAETYASTGQFAELDRVLLEAEGKVPDDLTPYYRAAAVLAGKDSERARRYLRKYLTQEPEAREPSHAQAKQLLDRIR